MAGRQQVDLPVTTVVLQHGDGELADEPACGQRLQLLLEADRQQLANHRGGAVPWGAKHRQAVACRPSAVR